MKGHGDWPRPTQEEVTHLIRNLPDNCCEDFDRVSLSVL